MKTSHKAIITASFVGLMSAPLIGFAPRIRTTEAAYYFDKLDTTIMIPRCEKTDNHEGCADNVVSAFLKWRQHK